MPQIRKETEEKFDKEFLHRYSPNEALYQSHLNDIKSFIAEIEAEAEERVLKDLLERFKEERHKGVPFHMDTFNDGWDTAYENVARAIKDSLTK